MPCIDEVVALIFFFKATNQVPFVWTNLILIDHSTRSLLSIFGAFLKARLVVIFSPFRAAFSHIYKKVGKTNSKISISKHLRTALVRHLEDHNVVEFLLRKRDNAEIMQSRKDAIRPSVSKEFAWPRCSTIATHNCPDPRPHPRPHLWPLSLSDWREILLFPRPVASFKRKLTSKNDELTNE